MFVVYILYSRGFDISYVGYTSDLILRIQSHNIFGTGYTRKFRPWIVVHIEFFDKKADAMKREKYFKSGLGFYERKNIIEKFIQSS
jgi:putative endonuclease